MHLEAQELLKISTHVIVGLWNHEKSNFNVQSV